MENIIISAVNIVEGGALTILDNCLKYLNTSELLNNYRIIAIVNKKSLFRYNNIEYIEIPTAKKSWLSRLYYEYIYFGKFAKVITPYLWFSLHDISPSVNARRRVVYCHNPAPFYKFRIKDFYLDYKLVLFSLFYKYIYRINIKRNNYVIVQQDWLRNEFSEMFNLKKEKIVVAYPNQISNVVLSCGSRDVYTFFFPSYPRLFKNIEIICEAVNILSRENGLKKYEVIITINGTENKYARWVYDKYKYLRQIRFTGILSRDQIENYYRITDCMIFPSRLETWGLPISEFSPYKKPMLVADLEYAHETVGEDVAVSYFNPGRAQELAKRMKSLINDDYSFLVRNKKPYIQNPFVSSWKELFNIILE